MIPRMFIGGKIPLSFVHLLQDCISDYEDVMKWMIENIERVKKEVV